jgi:hypothetical protein
VLDWSNSAESIHNLFYAGHLVSFECEHWLGTLWFWARRNGWARRWIERAGLNLVRQYSKGKESNKSNYSKCYSDETHVKTCQCINTAIKCLVEMLYECFCYFVWTHSFYCL